MEYSSKELRLRVLDRALLDVSDELLVDEFMEHISAVLVKILDQGRHSMDTLGTTEEG